MIQITSAVCLDANKDFLFKNEKSLFCVRVIGGYSWKYFVHNKFPGFFPNLYSYVNRAWLVI